MVECRGVPWEFKNMAKSSKTHAMCMPGKRWVWRGLEWFGSFFPGRNAKYYLLCNDIGLKNVLMGFRDLSLNSFFFILFLLVRRSGWTPFSGAVSCSINMANLWLVLPTTSSWLSLHSRRRNNLPIGWFDAWRSSRRRDSLDNTDRRCSKARSSLRTPPASVRSKADRARSRRFRSPRSQASTLRRKWKNVVKNNWFIAKLWA